MISMRSTIERGLLLTALGCLGYVGAVILDAKVYSAQQTRRLDALRAAREALASRTALVLPAPAGASPLMGRIDIPRIGISAIILDSDDPKSLRRGVCHIPDTALFGQTGNVVLAGHRDTVFRGLRRIAMHDTVIVTTPDSVYRYSVTATEVVHPESTEVLENSGGNVLTLVTCWPFGFIGPAPKRFVVHASRIGGAPARS
jgi:sortase A